MARRHPGDKVPTLGVGTKAPKGRGTMPRSEWQDALAVALSRGS